jgi:ABC-type phosphate transport system permease subunit
VIQRVLAGDQRVPFRIGLDYGLVAGAAGIVQWILIEQDLASRVAWFHEARLRYPSFFDYNPVVQGNQAFWMSTAAQTCVGALVVYTLAAFTASWLSQRQQDGLSAAWIAAAVGGTLYTVVAILAGVLGPSLFVTESIGQCVIVYALALACILYPLAYLGANIGARSSSASSRNRRMRQETLSRRLT